LKIGPEKDRFRRGVWEVNLRPVKSPLMNLTGKRNQVLKKVWFLKGARGDSDVIEMKELRQSPAGENGPLYLQKRGKGPVSTAKHDGW